MYKIFMMVTTIDEATLWTGDSAEPAPGEGENIVLYEEEAEDRDPLATLTDNETATIYTRLPKEQ